MASKLDQMDTLPTLDIPEFEDINTTSSSLPSLNLLGSRPQEQKSLKYTGISASSFTSLLLKTELNRAIKDCGFEHPSDIQQECLPSALDGRDILCQARSGMGKTAIFVLATLHRLELTVEYEGVSILVLCHTRELAEQIKKEYDRFVKYFNLTTETVRTMEIYGGKPIDEQRKHLAKKKPHIIIGTPGRVLALLSERGKDKSKLSLDNLKAFVIDECDQMLEQMDMRAQVQKIFMKSPYEKQVMMYSATFKPEISKVCRKFLRNPHEIATDQERNLTLDLLRQYYLKIDEAAKMKRLVPLLDDIEFNQAIIFVSKQERAEKLAQVLRLEQFPCTCTHGRLDQKVRNERIEEFKTGKTRIMVSTDLLGRGIDMGKINLVINFDMPIQRENSEEGRASDAYLHRVGRAGRFGTKGLAISFISSTEDEAVLADVQKRFEAKMGPLPAVVDKSLYLN